MAIEISKKQSKRFDKNIDDKTKRKIAKFLAKSALKVKKERDWSDDRYPTIMKLMSNKRKMGVRNLRSMVVNNNNVYGYSMRKEPEKKKSKTVKNRKSSLF